MTVAMMGFVEAVLLVFEGGGVLKVPRGEKGGYLEGLVVLNKRLLLLAMGYWLDGWC